MRTLIIAFAFLALTACSGNRQAKTVSEFEDRNPYAKLTQDSALPDGNRVRIYHDLVPRITASGHYSTELRTAALIHRGDTIIDQAHGVQLP
jgi:hypothetical protein